MPNRVTVVLKKKMQLHISRQPGEGILNIPTMKERQVPKVMYMLISPDLMMIILWVYALQSIALYTKKKNLWSCCQLKIREMHDKNYFLESSP